MHLIHLTIWGHHKLWYSSIHGIALFLFKSMKMYWLVFVMRQSFGKDESVTIKDTYLQCHTCITLIDCYSIFNWRPILSQCDTVFLTLKDFSHKLYALVSSPAWPTLMICYLLYQDFYETHHSRSNSDRHMGNFKSAISETSLLCQICILSAAPS